MSVIVASGETINKSPLNQSKSKQMYSFPKASRFPKLRTSNSCSFYNIPVKLDKRATSFGMGTKYDFTKGGKGINPQFYNNKSDFDQSNSHTPRYTFGESRDKYDKVYYESNKMFDKFVPGPGKYDILKPFGYDAIKYTISSRSKMMNSVPLTPGPGQYANIFQINDKGIYSYSKIRNIPQINMACDKSQRSSYNSNKNPGPLDYPQRPLLGTIFNSKHFSSPKMSMHQKLHPFSRNNNPGPGTYRIFSDFGIYESKNAASMRSSFKDNSGDVSSKRDKQQD